jgi:hypothetical protein
MLVKVKVLEKAKKEKVQATKGWPPNQLKANLTHSPVLGWTHLKVHKSVIAESWDLEGAPDF